MSSWYVWGLLMGIGLAVVMVLTKVIDLDLTMVIVVVAAATVVGVLWSTVAPAEAPEGPPPATVTVAGERAPVDDVRATASTDASSPRIEQDDTNDHGDGSD